MTLRPAYGREYKSAKAIQADMDAGKDFDTASMDIGYGQKINNQDLKSIGVSKVMVRYQQDRKIAEIKIK